MRPGQLGHGRDIGQLALDVLLHDEQVLAPQACGEVLVQLGGLGVHRQACSAPGVAAEERVRE